MRIAWCSPFNTQSAIARYSRYVVDELRLRGFDVEGVCVEAGDASELPVLETRFPLRRAVALAVIGPAHGFDLSVTNLGNYAAFHGECVKAMLPGPTVAVFHDCEMSSLAGVLPRPTRRVEPGSQHGRGDGDAVLAMFASLAAGAVAHGPHYVDALRNACPGPVEMIPLCYPDLGSIEPRCTGQGDFIVATLGMMNKNKQPDRIMHAIAKSSRLRDRALYRIIGPITDEQKGQLTALAASLGIRAPEMHGWVSDKVLSALASEANVICCIRYPISEGGSASLISSLYTARPVIVADAGFYSLVPDDFVFKVSYGSATDDLVTALESVAEDQAAADRRAKCAREWARETFSAKAYADRLIPFLEQCLNVIPVIDAGRRMGRTLQGFGVSFGDPAVTRIAQTVQELFASNAEEGPRE
jgi:glycosyltransferase involved in cell wall biosynthesis